MKNNLFYSAMMLLLVCAFSGCDDDKDPEAGLTPAVIQGKVYAYDTAEAGVQWETSQIIGITMLKANSTESVAPYHHIKYKTTVYPVGYFTPVSTEDVLYYPEDGSKVDITAFHPYKDNLKDDLYPVNVATQSTSANFSLLYANNSKGLNKDNKKTIIELRPAVTQFIVKLEAGDGVVDEYLVNSVVTFAGMPTKANFNLLTGTFQDQANVQSIALPALSEGYGASGSILPAASTDGFSVLVTLPAMGGRVLTRTIASTTPELKGGTRYTGILKVSLDKIEFISINEEPIQDWEEDEPIQGGGSQFLIKPISTLAEGDLKESKGNNPFATTSGIAMDSWFKTVNATTVQWRASVQSDPVLERNVLYLSHTGGAVGWYQSFIGYRMGKADLSIYTVKFRVKGTGKINCFLKTSSNLCPLLESTVAKVPTYKEITVTPDYTEYSVDFDFSIAGTSGRASYVKEGVDKDAKDAVASDYDDFYVGFYPTATNSSFVLDNVSLTKKKQN